jgi:hypothetical protein
MKRTGFLILIILFFGANYCIQAQKTKSANISEEEYQIYSVVLESRGKNIVLMKTLMKAGFIKEDEAVLKRKFPQILEEIFQNFSTANLKDYSFDKEISISKKCFLINEAKNKSYFRKDGGGWEQFYQDYPESDGILKFSAIGFSNDKQQALVYASRQCGGLCAEGIYYFLIKQKDKWVIIGKSAFAFS